MVVESANAGTDTVFSASTYTLGTNKVLVHKGLTTLHVLTLGMVGLAVFEAILGGLRTYVFSHTSCRIDVSLGAQLFQHILHLPLAYFQACRVGDTVARARELETIRQFLTGSTVTIALDFFFATVFLVLMLYYSVLLTTVIALVWLGADLGMGGQLTIGQLIAFNMLSGRVSGPVVSLRYRQARS